MRPLAGCVEVEWLADAVHVADEGQQAALGQAVQRRAEGDLDDAGVAADLDGAGNRGAVLHFG